MAQKNKKKHLFNIIDVLIILLVLIVAATGIFIVFFRRGSDPLRETVHIEYVLELRRIRDEFADNIKVGDEIVDSSAKFRLGKVISVAKSASIFTGTDLKNGELVYHDYPEHSDVAFTIRTDATMDEEGYYMIDKGYRMTVGTIVYVRTPNYVGTAYCTELKKTEVQ